MDENVKELYEEQTNRLESLREITRLNPIDFFRVQQARRQAEKFRELYIKENPSDIIGVDYSVADDLEYSLRFRQLERNVEKSWKSYLGLENDGYGLAQYAEDFLLQHMNEKGQTGKHRM